MRWEVALDVELADGLAEGLLDQTDAASALAHLGHAGQGAAVEVEVLLDESRRQVGRVAGVHDVATRADRTLSAPA